MASYIFDPSRGETPDTLAKKRRVAEALLASSTERMPQNGWEGLAAVARAISGRMGMNAVAKDEAAGRASANASMASLFGQGAFPPAPGQGAPSSAPDVPDVNWGGRTSTARPTPSQDEFVSMLMPAAIEASQRTGIDPRIIVAQAAQETGWGRAAPGNNYFGIKSHGQGGGQTFTTHEVVNGQRVKIKDSFRQFASPADSVAGYADFMTHNPRYRGMREAQGLDAQLQALGASGYATDPNYASSVGAIARAINLPNQQVASIEPTSGMERVANAMASQPAAAPAPQSPGAQRVAQAMGGGQPAESDWPGHVPVQPGNGNPTLQQLMQAAQNPWLSEQQSGVLNLMLKQQMEQADPVRQLQIQKLRQEVSQGSRPEFKVVDGRLVQINPDGSIADATPQAPGGADVFSGSSVEAQSLNYLIRNGHLTPDQAAQIGAGKTITDPTTGAIIFMTPQGVFGQPQGGQPQPLTPPVSAPAPVPQNSPALPPAAATPPAGRPGMIPITDPKAQKPTEAQRNRVGNVDQAFKAIGSELDRYAELVGQTGIEAAPGEAKDNLNTVRQGIMLQMKELFNLGVLNGPDLSLMERMIYDPVIDVGKDGGWSNLPDQIYTGIFGGAGDRAQNSVKELKRMLENIKSSVDTSVQSQTGVPAPAAPSDGWTTLPNGVKIRKKQ